MTMSEVTGANLNETLDDLTTQKTNNNTDSGSCSANINHIDAKDDPEGRTEGSADINSRKRKIDDEESQNNDKSTKDEDRITIPDDQENDSSAYALYGLSLQYLKSLKITPPLDQWIQFRCDKSELRDVLELAGHVVLCAVMMKRTRIAKVMYSHPLEAVQAVSMFQGQMFYGQKLNVIMLKNPSSTVVLPKGLNNVGPGLGKFGKPLRNVAEQYRSFLEHKQSNVDPILFLHPDGSSDKTSDGGAISVKSFAYMKPSNVINVVNVDEDLEESQKSNKKSRIIRSNTVAHITLTDSEHSSTDTDSVDLTLDDNDSRSPASVTISTLSPVTRTLKPATSSAPQTIRTLKAVIPTVSQPQNPVPRMCPPPSRMEVRPPMFMQGPMNPMVPGGNMPNPGPLNMNMGPPGVSGPYGPPNGPHFPANPRMMSNPNIGPVFGPSGNPLPPGAPMPTPTPIPVAAPMPNTAPMPNMGPMPNTAPMPNMGPMPNTAPMPNMGPMPNTSPTRPAAPMPAAGPMPFTTPGSITLHFRNLPPTTTFALLSEKVSLCGQVLSLRLTTPGCAVAVFAVKSDAERCCRFFHGKCIDGCVVEVCMIG